VGRLIANRGSQPSADFLYIVDTIETKEAMSPGKLKSLCSLFGVVATWLSCGTAAAEPPKDIVTSTRSAVSAAHLTPRDTGSRYGQALGAVEVCAGTKVTEKASALSKLYSGAEIEEFNAQEKKIYDAWMKVKHCVREDDPNQCTVIVDESCAAAMTEIGPKGTALPGLLEVSRPELPPGTVTPPPESK
jgi:hypothetical protein